MKTIEEIIAELTKSREDAAERSEEERTILAAAMGSLGVLAVEILFCGSGDSGNIDEVNITMREGYEEPEDLKQKLIDWADGFLEGTGVDWYNNEGGQGTLEFDLSTAPHQFKATVEYNVMSSEIGYEYEGAA